MKIKIFLVVLLFGLAAGTQGQVFKNHNIANDVDQPRRIMPGDLDNDGDQDLVIVTTSDPTPMIFCLENVNSSFNILDSVLIQVGYYDARGLALGDLDGDGDLDVCVTGKTDTVFAWWANDGNPFDGTAFSSANVLGTLGGSRIYNVEIGNVDGVNGQDIVVPYAYGDAVSYWENDGAASPLFTERVINNHWSDNVLFAVWASVGDIDNDGLMDVIATANDYINASDSGRVTWFKNSGIAPDGEANAWISTDIDTLQRYPFTHCVQDVDRDGDIDVIVGSNDGTGTESQQLILYLNDGTGSSWTAQTVASPFDDAEFISSRDLDGDGYIDILAGNDAGILRLFYNDGTNVFPPAGVVTLSSHYRGVRTIYPADLDNDGDPDLVSVSLDGDSLDWWESDAEDKQIVLAGDSSFFWNSDVKVIFNSSSGGLDTTTVFYDSEDVPSYASVGSGVVSVFSEGFYTLTTEKTTYSADLKFSYANIPRWTNLGNENDLIICSWDGTAWQQAGTSQTIDTRNDTIKVSGVTQFGKFALGKAISVEANIVAFLEGPYDAAGDTMYTALLQNDMLPLSQPYDTATWNYSGTESVLSIPDNVVDWVLLELRSGTAASTVVAKRAAFILKDGSIVDTDGTSPVLFKNLSEGYYYIAIYHRNHLSAMSAVTLHLLSAGSTIYNFSSSASQYYGNDAKLLETGVYGSYAGDNNQDGNVTVSDNNLVMDNRNSQGYQDGDSNIDGNVTVSDNNMTMGNRNMSTQVPQ